MSRKPPRWEHIDAVAQRVRDELDEAEYRSYVEEYQVPPLHLPPLPVPDFDKEQEAAAAAFKRDGNVEPLADLILDWMPQLDWSTFLLVQNLLHAGNPKSKPRRGRHKMTEAARRKMNPLHDAADEVDRISRVLKRLYSKRPEQDVKGRAIDIAAMWHKVDRVLLANFVVPSKRKRRP